MVHSITPVLQVGIWSSSSNSYWEVEPASGETYAPTWQPAAWEYFTKSSVLVYHQDWAILPSLVVHWFKTLCFDCMSVGLIPGQRSSTCHEVGPKEKKKKKKIGLSCICFNMDVCRDYYTKWSKPDIERQISYHLYVESQKKYKWIYSQDRNRPTDIENKLTVTKGKRGEG